MIAMTRVWPFCLVFLIYCVQLGSAANSVEKRAATSLSKPVAPPGDGAVTVIQSTVEDRTPGQKLTTYVVYEKQKTGNLQTEITKKIREAATEVLNEWKTSNKDFVLRTPPVKLHFNKDVRLDFQNTFNRDGIEFANLQLQINGKGVPWPSSVAQVSIEIGTSQNTKRGLQGMTKGKEVLYAATALDASLRQGRNTWVFQEWTDARGRLLERNPRG